MTQAEFAANLGTDTGRLSKMLKGPANWTLKTFGHMVEALNGELEIIVHDRTVPPDQPRNYDAYDAADADDTQQAGVTGNAMIEPPQQEEKPGVIGNVERSG